MRARPFASIGTWSRRRCSRRVVRSSAHAMPSSPGCACSTSCSGRNTNPTSACSSSRTSWPGRFSHGAAGAVFRPGQGLCPAIERNRRQERQALRRAFTKALPDLLPGTSIARKKPGYGWKKGRADFFLSQQADLCPTQLLRQPVSQTCVETLREAIQASQPRGYVVAPVRTWSWTTPWSLCPLGARTWGSDVGADLRD